MDSNTVIFEQPQRRKVAKGKLSQTNRIIKAIGENKPLQDFLLVCKITSQGKKRVKVTFHEKNVEYDVNRLTAWFDVKSRPDSILDGKVFKLTGIHGHTIIKLLRQRHSVLVSKKNFLETKLKKNNIPTEGHYIPLTNRVIDYLTAEASRNLSYSQVDRLLQELKDVETKAVAKLK